MKLLALDTSSEGCSAALLVDGNVTERFEFAPRGHTRLLMPMIKELLAEQRLVPADLDAIGFACGPGSFTGLRIATGVVQGLSYGLDIPVVPVSSLAAVALDAIERFSVGENKGVAVAFDARMGEVYWGCFVHRHGLPELIGSETVCAPESIELPETYDPWLGVGQGWTLRERMPGMVNARIQQVETSLVPRAASVVRIASQEFGQGRAVPAAQAQPVYVRDEVTWKKLPGR